MIDTIEEWLVVDPVEDALMKRSAFAVSVHPERQFGQKQKQQKYTIYHHHVLAFHADSTTTQQTQWCDDHPDKYEYVCGVCDGFWSSTK